MLLQNQVILLTDAASEWGKSAIFALTQQGATVIGITRTSISEKSCNDQESSRRPSFENYMIDIMDDIAMKTLFNNILEDHHRLDVLINNATIESTASFIKSSMPEVDHIFKFNLRAPLIACKYAIPIMKRQKSGGSIINVSSSDNNLTENEGAFSASKYGLDGLTKSISIELADHIAVNSVTPPICESTNSNEDDYFDTIIFLSMQRTGGVTGKRLSGNGLSKRIMKNGWEIQASDLYWNSKINAWE